MSKGAKIFIGIIYYLVAFVFGLFLAIMLPYTMHYTALMRHVSTSLAEGNYSDSIRVVGGYFNDEYAYQQNYSEGGIVLFEAVTLVYNSGEENDETVDESRLHKAYAGYIYGVNKVYDYTSNEANLAGIGIFNGSGVERRDTFIDYDSDDDGNKDTNSNLYTYDFLFLDLDCETFDKITKIVMYDKDGNVFSSIELDLDFSGSFFSDVDEFVNEYNANPASENLQALNDSFLAKNSHYQISSFGDIQTKSNKKAITIIIIYFVFIYLLGDTIVGKRYFLKGIKWILKKVFKVKFKSDEVPVPEQVYGNDYFSTVTVKLDTSGASDLNTAVIIKYSNEKVGNIEFTLMKSEGYSQTRRIQAGTYYNPWVEISDEFLAYDMPNNLVVRGYRMEVVIKIKKK